jgi:hypothetical protein
MARPRARAHWDLMFELAAEAASRDTNQPPEIEIVIDPDGREDARLRRDPPPGEIATYVAYLFNSMSYMYPPGPDDVLVTEHGEVIRNPAAAARKAVLAVVAGNPQEAMSQVFMTGVTMGVHPAKTQLEQHTKIIAVQRESGHDRATPADKQQAIRAFYLDYVAAHGERGAIRAAVEKFGVSRPTASKYAKRQ